MTKNQKYIVEPLSSAHNRDNFDCGVDDLNRFIKQFASQNQKKKLTRTYVCIRPDKSVVGYYSLAFGSVHQEGAPEFMTRGIGKYQIPVMIIGRLAIDRSEQGKGLGVALLKDAVIRTKKAEEIGGLRAIIVHAKDNNAQAFYTKYGFIPSLNDPLTLFFPIEFDL